jgi:Cu-Zn family superoxide dismutase
MAHAGDMGNIEIGENGSGTLIVFMPGLSLSQGEANVTGKAVILHEQEDDFGQPTGNAGGRIGCGVITLNK